MSVTFQEVEAVVKQLVAEGTLVALRYNEAGDIIYRHVKYCTPEEIANALKFPSQTLN